MWVSTGRVRCGGLRWRRRERPANDERRVDGWDVRDGSGVAAVGLGIAAAVGPPEGVVTVAGLAVLLAHGVVTEPKTGVRPFAPGRLREDVPQETARREAVALADGSRPPR
jgi:hypothetical protein